MKAGIVTVLLLLIGTIATHFLLENNGYVLISFRGYTVEMSVPVLLFLILLVYLAIRLVVHLWRAPRQIGEMAARARVARSGRNITRGFIALSEGKLARGEQLITKGAAHSEAPVVNYLAAARTAQMQGDRNRRDGWLKIAYEQDDASRNAVLLTQAELQMADGDYESARASLNKVRDSQPQHPQALKMLAELHRLDGEWDVFIDLLPTLRKAKIVPVRQLDAWTVEANAALLGAPDIARARIEELWSILPRNLRKSPPLIRARAKALLTAGESTLAETEIRKALKQEWDDELVTLFGEMKPVDAGAHLKQTEAWLAARPEDPVLLLAAGRACIRNELWGKARSYLESCLAIRPSPAAYDELGQLMLRLDDREAATSAFARGLTLSNKGAPDVPRLEGGGRA
ncbi:MAG: heme biosynthesis HemY N-terminal domain-containing protein [Gammaproteobacteria bacterium]